MKLNVISYNIHKGLDWFFQKVIIDKIKKAVEKTAADIVFLQEIVGQNKAHEKKYQNWPSETQFEYLADEMWPHFAYGKNAIFIDRHHGNAILSRFPIVSWEKQDISTNKREQRGLLKTKILLPKDYFADSQDRFLQCYCLHLDLFHRGRIKQYQQIKKIFRKPLLIMNRSSSPEISTIGTNSPMTFLKKS